MFIVREVLHCKPGKVGELVKKFKGLSAVMKQMGFKPFRILTDVSGERYWTLVAETEVDSLDGMRKMEEKVMANEEARQHMGGYHDLIEQGRREIYSLEA